MTRSISRVKKRGTEMRTKMVQSYANLFMTDLENNLIAMNSTKPKVWWQCIDDIFTIWEHSQESLELFLQKINVFHTTIKFMAETSTECVTFLDTMVILENDILHTDLYPTSICHPKHCTTSIHTARVSDLGESAQKERTLYQKIERA